MIDTPLMIVQDAEEILEVLIESRELVTDEEDDVARDLLRRIREIKAANKKDPHVQF